MSLELRKEDQDARHVLGIISNEIGKVIIEGKSGLGIES